LPEQTAKRVAADSTAMRVPAVQSWVVPRKPVLLQIATGLHLRKAAVLNRMCLLRRRILAAIATPGIIQTRATGPRKETSPMAVELHQDLVPFPETRIGLIALPRQAQEITVRDTR
jgi:hypothetical protein